MLVLPLTGSLINVNAPSATTAFASVDGHQRTMHNVIRQSAAAIEDTCPTQLRLHIHTTTWRGVNTAHKASYPTSWCHSCGANSNENTHEHTVRVHSSLLQSQDAGRPQSPSPLVLPALTEDTAWSAPDELRPRCCCEELHAAPAPVSAPPRDRKGAGAADAG